MKQRTRSIVLVVFAAVLVLRELGWVRLDIAHTSSRENTSVTRYVAPDWLDAPLGEIEVEVLPSGEGLGEVELIGDGGVRVVVATEGPEVEGLDWVPLFKRVSYSAVAVAAYENEAGDSGFLQPLEGTPAGFQFELEGQRMILGFQARRSLRAELREELEDWVRETVVEGLREADAKARAERAAEAAKDAEGELPG